LFRVTEPAKFVQEPTDVSVSIGDKLSIPCKAAGYPQPVVTWSSIGSKAVTVLDGDLVFENVDMSVRGRYRCEASNGAGDPVSKEIEIRVNGIHMTTHVFSFSGYLYSIPLILYFVPLSQCQPNSRKSFR
jgi:hypothetical protein